MKKQLPFILGSLVLFILLSIIYFSPLLSGNALFQQDIMQYRGGAEEQIKYRDTFDKETYWSDSMFSGMPTYQSGAQYSNNFLKYIDKAFGLFLPRPANYFFMMFAGFFLLGMVWLKDWRYALAGAIFFGFSTYFFQITEAGHNAKVHTIIYFAPFLAGLWLLFEKKYVFGFLLATLSLGLQLNANHPQMTFYLFVALSAFGVYQLVMMFRNKNYFDVVKSISLLLLAVALAVGMNSARLLSTYEFSKESTRGASELTQKDDNTTTGLDKSYITDWSYGKLETLNLMIPNFYGGGNMEKDFKSPKFDDAKKSIERNVYRKAEPLQQEAQQIQAALEQNPNDPALQQRFAEIEQEFNKLQLEYSKALEGYRGSYWGEQPFTSGPAYVGAIVCLLAILALFWIRHPYKWWLLGATILSFMMAWGKNFPAFTNFMIDYFPFYNKFRAVSSALVVSELTIPALAMLGLYEYFQNKDAAIDKKNEKSLIIVGGITVLFLVILYLVGNQFLPFHSETESESMASSVLKALEEDRFAFFRKDVLRTSFYVGLSLILLYLYQKKIIKNTEVLLGGLVFLSLIDLWTVDKRYLSKESFVPSVYMKNPFITGDVSDKMISDYEQNPKLGAIFNNIPLNNKLKDIKDKNEGVYRVFNRALNPFSENTTSFFHQSLGGYQGIKIGRYQDVIDKYLSDSVNTEVVNMLNAKFLVFGDPQEPQSVPNIDNNGNAWFVQKVTKAKTPDEELALLAKFNSKREAIVPESTKFSKTLGTDSTSVVKLDTYQPNKITYTSQSSVPQLAVFSEIYYPHGWVAKVDGKEVPIIKTNYILRGLELDAGNHNIVFEFNPPIVKTGEMIQLISFLLFLLISGVGLYLYNQSRKTFTSNVKENEQ